MLSPLSGVAVSITLNDITNTEDNKKHVQTIIEVSDQRNCLCSIKIIEKLLEFVNDSGSMINEFRQDKIRFKFSALRVKTFANMINCRCCVITTLHTSSLLLPLLHSHLLVPSQSEEQS